LFVAVINSPKIVDRTEAAPSKGAIERVRASIPDGFRLHPWSQIKLQIAKPASIDDGEPHAAIISGKRALHFCRAHIRFRLGRLEYVGSHWRGDPALGIRHATYKVTG